MSTFGTGIDYDYCPCCGEPLGLPGLSCGFCGYTGELSQGPSYGEVFDIPFRQIEIQQGLERLDVMLARLDRIDQELADVCSVFSS